jgi:hypothetical protein
MGSSMSPPAGTGLAGEQRLADREFEVAGRVAGAD